MTSKPRSFHGRRAPSLRVMAVRSTPKGYHYRISENLRRAEIFLESTQRFLQVRNNSLDRALPGGTLSIS